jgi:hypothetical protein
MEMTLTKTRTYKLEPYGKFCFKWERKQVKQPHQILISTIQIKYDTAMPMSKEQEKELVKEMKKYKTDVFTNGSQFYTLTNDGLTEIWHQKFMEYGTNEAYRNAVDSVTRFH